MIVTDSCNRIVTLLRVEITRFNFDFASVCEPEKFLFLF